MKPSKKERAAFYLRAAKLEASRRWLLSPPPELTNMKVKYGCFHYDKIFPEMLLVTGNIAHSGRKNIKELRILCYLLCYQMCK